jgi:hypothetical protein
VLETTEQTKREEAYGVRRGEAQWVKEAERARSSSRTDKRKGLRGGANMGNWRSGSWWANAPLMIQQVERQTGFASQSRPVDGRVSSNGGTERGQLQQ